MIFYFYNLIVLFSKVWQYITLTKRIYLIDCPGIVYTKEGVNEVSVVLKGVVRAERLEDPAYYIREVLEKAKAKDLEKIYGVSNWIDEDDFLKKVAEKKGRLLKVIFCFKNPYCFA